LGYGTLKGISKKNRELGAKRGNMGLGSLDLSCQGIKIIHEHAISTDFAMGMFIS
jgi:hypothetical protein